MNDIFVKASELIINSQRPLCCNEAINAFANRSQKFTSNEETLFSEVMSSSLEETNYNEVLMWELDAAFNKKVDIRLEQSLMLLFVAEWVKGNET